MTQTIKDAAAKVPNKTAFKFENESISFEDLACRANQLAAVLAEQGVERGDRVGIFLTASIETSTAVYGIMNAGAAYVPIDTTLPTERISCILKDCGIRHLVSNEHHKAKLTSLLKMATDIESVIGVENDLPVRTVPWEALSQMPDREVSVRVLDDDLAYIMYTSGTTGVPKGIIHTHRSGLNYAELSKDLYRVGSGDIFGNHSPLHFDISTFGYFTMPLAKGTTVVIPEAYKSFPTSLSKIVDDEKLTIWYSVPLALIQMLERGDLAKRNLESLRWVLFGGEPFPIDSLRSLVEIVPNARFSNVYGPAEVNQCTFYNFTEIPKRGTPVPLGKAWDNTEILVVDENDEEVEKGEIGECLVRTATMMKGYWQQPELTKKSIYEKETKAGQREFFYRTGDLVRYDENGDIIFAGRKDRQIKMRGYRIELDEIESVLTAHTKVIQAAVYSLVNGDERVLAANVVLKSGALVTPRQLAEHCEKYLPAYAKLTTIFISESIPRTSAGKVSYRQLEKAASVNFK